MNQDYLKNYARLLVETGLNIIPGDSLKISLSEESLPLVRLITEEAYKRGALRIYYDLRDDAMTLARYLYGSDESFASVPEYDVEAELARFKDRTHRLSISASDPELLKDVDSQRIAAWRKTAGQAMRPVQELGMANKMKWCVAAVPSEAWAVQVFPELAPADAVERLWELIFEVTRANTEDPVQAWQDHNATLKHRESFMNDHRFSALRYEAPGTSFEVGLVKRHVWVGGASPFESGEAFMANIPTEEVFTMPDRNRAEGRLQATLPLSLNGRMVKDFWFEFKEGQVIDFGAAEGKEVLKELLDTDEGARRLGEAALVDVDSPIYRTGVLFKNTLFDENASCHFALGAAYSENLEGAGTLTPEEKLAAGMNDSLIHVDFMVGSDALNITGIKENGEEIAVMRKGKILDR